MGSPSTVKIMNDPCPRCAAEREVVLRDELQAIRCPRCGFTVGRLTPEQAEVLRHVLTADRAEATDWVQT